MPAAQEPPDVGRSELATADGEAPMLWSVLEAPALGGGADEGVGEPDASGVFDAAPHPTTATAAIARTASRPGR